MRYDDPFDSLARTDEMGAMAGFAREMRDASRALLDELEQELDAALAAGRPPAYSATWSYLPLYMTLPAADAARAQELSLRVLDQGGPHNAEVQAALLGLVARVAAPESIPFWREMLALTISRDQFSKRRKAHATAALAWMLARRGEAAALELLLVVLRAPDADVRALAAEHLGRALTVPKTRAPKAAVIAALTRAATEDKAAQPRIAARFALKDAEAPLPLDLPGGAYAFKVWRAYDVRVHRVIELEAEQSFDQLHNAIQDAFGWDADHLYVFWLTGKERDRRYELGHSEMDDVHGYAHAVALGEAGLVKGHTFLYLFDFGDNHLFRVKVVGTRATAGPGPFPRIVDSVGKAPPQYGDFD